jgi:hypothetical protein
MSPPTPLAPIMTTSPLATALAYVAKFGWPVFLLGWTGPGRRRPLLKRPGERGTGGFYQASTDPSQITTWWRQYPKALIGTPTGRPSGLIVLDIDRKAACDGYMRLEELGRSILPQTPMSITPSGGNHVFFACNKHVEIRCSTGKYGLGSGLDVRGEGGYVPLPTPGSGYRWDPHVNLDTVPLASAPAWLGHRTKSDRTAATGRGVLDPEAILAEACDNIRRAGPGERHYVLNREIYGIAGLVAAGALKESDARHDLRTAAAAMVSATGGDRKKAEEDFAGAWQDGLRRPRRVRR